MNNLGIDYGLGQANIDKANGIRYGVISQHSVGQSWYDEAEPYYGKPEETECPHCNTLLLHGDIEWGNSVICDNCGEGFEVELSDFVEPISWFFEDKDYSIETCLDSDLMILKSPYYTFAQFCSPCVPGAGNLDNFRKDGIKTYCLGHDWFEDGKAPYPIYHVSDGQLVE